MIWEIKLILLWCLSVCLEYAGSSNLQTSFYTRTDGTQFKVIRSEPYGSLSYCSMLCNPDQICIGFDVYNNECIMYNTEVDLSLPPKTIMMWDITHKDCSMASSSEVHSLKLTDGTWYQAYCDGGWTVILRRVDNSQNFYLSWEDYKKGFGDQENNYWLGNDIIHKLTNEKDYMLRLEFTYWGTIGVKYAQYQTFRIANETNNYRLTVSGYTGNSWDALGVHNNARFSTWDTDNDGNGGLSCAQIHGGGFWYGNCAVANPTGLYKNGLWNCMYWRDGTYRCLSYVIMKIKPQ